MDYKKIKDSKYKYELVNQYSIQLPEELIPGSEILTDYIIISSAGWMTVKNGYQWDGASGPTIDSKGSMRGSLVHDALYQLIREKRLPKSCRKDADQLFKKICNQDGLGWFRAGYYYWGVRLFGWACV